MLTIPTPDPAKLLADIKAAITNGTIKTWTVDSDGDFSHTDSQLAVKGFYLRPEQGTAELRFRTLFLTTTTDKKARRFGYAYLHGHMAEMLVTHFPDRVTAGQTLKTTPNPSSADTAL